MSTPPSALGAVLWDMDGLLVDTEPLWTVAEQEFAGRRGGTFTAEMKTAIVGTRLDLAVPLLLSHLGCPVTPASTEEGMGELLQRMVELYAGELVLMPGAVRLLAALAEQEVPQALVSSSYRVLVDAMLASGVGPFAVTVAGDEVTRGKPAPEPYLRAAAALGVDPSRCVVLEDSPSGVVSGQAAGCAVLAVPSVPGVVVPPAPRTRVVESLRAVGAGDLRLLALGERD